MKSSVNENDVDHLLRQFFRRETPTRWPEAPRVPAVVPASQSWTLSAGRMLVAGSLIATVALYVSLSGFFASEHKAGLNPNGPDMIGQRPGVKNVKTPPLSPPNP